MAATPSAPPSRRDLFLGFLKIGLMGFGGVAAIARHVIVVEREWLGDEEYGRLLGLCQALPGANTVNVAVMLGDRFQGVPGALISVAGIMAMPLTALVAAATAYAHVASHPLARLVLTGAAVSAAGLILGAAAKLLVRARPSPAAWGCAAAAMVAVAGFEVPLPWALAGIAPLSLGIAVWTLRR